MSNYRLVKFQQQNIRMLKRDYGSAITVYELLTATTNLDSGIKAATYNSYPISRAIVLPSHVMRAAIQSISLISANKKVLQGGTFDSADRTFIIDKADLPSGFTLKKDDWIEYKECRYDLKFIDEYEDETSLLIVGKRIEGVTPELHQRSYPSSTITFTENASCNHITDPNWKFPAQVVGFTQTASGVITP